MHKAHAHNIIIMRAYPMRMPRVCSRDAYFIYGGISLVVQYRTEMFPIFLGIIPLGFLCISKKLKNKFGKKLFEYNYS